MAGKSTVIRELKTGGYSPCAAKEENVGKRKCKHIPDSVSFELKKDKLGKHLEEITIPQDFVDMPKKDKVKFATSLVDTLEPISKQKANSVVNKLREL